MHFFLRITITHSGTSNQYRLYSFVHFLNWHTFFFFSIITVFLSIWLLYFNDYQMNCLKFHQEYLRENFISKNLINIDQGWSLDYKWSDWSILISERFSEYSQPFMEISKNYLCVEELKYRSDQYEICALQWSIWSSKQIIPIPCRKRGVRQSMIW